MMIHPQRKKPDEATLAIFQACDALIRALDIALANGEAELYSKLKQILIETFALAEGRDRH